MAVTKKRIAFGDVTNRIRCPLSANRKHWPYKNKERLATVCPKLHKNERPLVFDLRPVDFNGVFLNSRKHERRSFRIGDDALYGFGG
jgi:hypothetical protein